MNRIRLIATALTVTAAITACQGIDPPGQPPPPPHPLLGYSNGPYVDPSGTAARWVAANRRHPLRQQIEQHIADMPIARRLDGSAQSAKREAARYVAAATRANQIPMIVTEILPEWRCSNAGSRTAVDAAAFRAWVTHVAEGIGDRPAIVVLEPGHLTPPSCADDAERQDHASAIDNAVNILSERARRAHVLLDAGDAGTVDKRTMADRLKAAGIDKASGFALNIGSYTPTDIARAYGADLHALLEEMTTRSDLVHLIDTSRSGGAAPSSNCNPSEAKLGTTPGLGGPKSQAQALWLTTPGISDGACGAAPDSRQGQFVPELAQRLIGG